MKRRTIIGWVVFAVFLAWPGWVGGQPPLPDLSPPRVELVFPRNGQCVNFSDTRSADSRYESGPLRGRAFDSGGLKELRVFVSSLSGARVGETGFTFPNFSSGRPATEEAFITGFPRMDVPSGEYEVRVQVTDVNNNSGFAVVRVRHDSGRRVLRLVSPASPVRVLSGARIRIRVDVDDMAYRCMGATSVWMLVTIDRATWERNLGYFRDNPQHWTFRSPPYEVVTTLPPGRYGLQIGINGDRAPGLDAALEEIFVRDGYITVLAPPPIRDPVGDALPGPRLPRWAFPFGAMEEMKKHISGMMGANGSRSAQFAGLLKRVEVLERRGHGKNLGPSEIKGLKKEIAALTRDVKRAEVQFKKSQAQDAKALAGLNRKLDGMEKSLKALNGGKRSDSKHRSLLKEINALKGQAKGNLGARGIRQLNDKVSNLGGEINGFAAQIKKFQAQDAKALAGLTKQLNRMDKQLKALKGDKQSDSKRRSLLKEINALKGQANGNLGARGIQQLQKKVSNLGVEIKAVAHKIKKLNATPSVAPVGKKLPVLKKQ